MNSWMNSSGHRANIMATNTNKIGIGVAADSKGQLYFTQLFTDGGAAGNNSSAPAQQAVPAQQAAPTQQTQAQGIENMVNSMTYMSYPVGNSGYFYYFGF